MAAKAASHPCFDLTQNIPFTRPGVPLNRWRRSRWERNETVLPRGRQRVRFSRHAAHARSTILAVRALTA